MVSAQDMKGLRGLLHLLERREVTVSVKEAYFHAGLPAFEFLTEQVRSGSLTDRQLRNAITVMFQMTARPAFGRQGELLFLLRPLCGHQDRSVRTAAAMLLIRLVELGSHFPELALPGREAVVNEIRMALDQGLDPPRTDFVREFLETGGPGV